MNTRWVGPFIAIVIVAAVVLVLVLNLERPAGQDGTAEPPAGAGDAGLTTGHAMPVASGSLEGKQPLMPMVAKDGPHYGATVKMLGHGRYRLIYTIHPPDPLQFGRHSDPITGVAPWWGPFSVEFTFNFQGVPLPDSEEARQRGNLVAPGFREYPIEPAEGYQQNHLDVKAVWLPPIKMEGTQLPQDPNVIHLEADIRADDANPNGFYKGEWVPYLRVEFELIRLE